MVLEDDVEGYEGVVQFQFGGNPCRGSGDMKEMSLVVMADR